MSTDNPIAVDFTVDQKDNLPISYKLQQDGSKMQDSVFTIAFSDDVYPYPGKISVIDRAVDPQTGTIKVRLDFSK